MAVVARAVPRSFAWNMTPPRVPILDAYVARAVIAPFGFAFAAYLMFWFVNIFFLAADYVINAHAPIFLVLRFLVFRLPQAAQLGFPFACLFGSLLGLGRLAQDSELLAMRAAGVSFLRIARAPLILGLIVTATSYVVADRLAPPCVGLSTRTFYQIIYHTATLPITPQIFRKVDSTGTVFYVGSIEADRRTMDNVMIFQNATSTPFRTTINAAKGAVDGGHLTLTNARLTKFKKTGEVDMSTMIATLSIPLPETAGVDYFEKDSGADSAAQTSAQMRQGIEMSSRSGVSERQLAMSRNLLADRIAMPFAALISVLIALPIAAGIGARGKAMGKGVGIAASILLLFVFYLLKAMFTAVVHAGGIDPTLAAWSPNIVLGCVGAFLFWRIERR